MARTGASARRSRGYIRKRGGSYQVLVYAGVDPLTGKDHYLTESTSDEAQAQKILTRLLGTVDEQRSPRTRATLGAALESWLRTHEAEETTLDGDRGYVRRAIQPALGDVPIAKITPQVLEEFYAELRRCRHRCRSCVPAVDYRTSATSSGIAAALVGPGPSRTTARKLAARTSIVRRTPADRWPPHHRSGRFTGS